MTYLQTHKRPYQRMRQNIAFGAAVVAIVIIVIQVISPRFFPGIFVAIARPFWRTEFSIRSGGLLSAETLLAEKEVLNRTLADMQVRLAATEALEVENAELKLLLGRDSTQHATSTSSSKSKNPPHLSKPLILAAVLRRPPVSGYDQLIMDIGRDYAISTSTLIYAQGNVLIGRVVDVFASTAKVRLFTSPGENIPVLIGSTHIAATAVGRGGGQYEAQISRESPVAEGDFVLGGSFDEKPIGIVSSVLLDPTQPFKTVLFAPPLNVYQIRWVLAQNND